MLDFINKNQIVPSIDTVFNIDEMNDAYKYILDRKQKGKIVISIDKDTREYKLISIGNRNPQGLAIHPVSSIIFDTNVALDSSLFGIFAHTYKEAFGLLTVNPKCSNEATTLSRLS